MPATLTTTGSLLKEIYEGQIRDQLQSECVGYKRILQTGEGVESTVGGKYVTFPIRTRRNSGLGYRNELELLPTAGQQGYNSVRIGLKYGYGRVRVSGPTMELAKTNPQAFANAMDLEVKNIKQDILKDTNRIFYGNGLGALAVTTAVATANVVTVASTQYLNLGDQIDIVSPGGTVRGTAGRNITAINRSTGVVTYDGADITTDVIGDFIVRTGSYGREPNGLGSIVLDTGVLFNVDPSSEPTWAATNNNNGGTLRVLSEGLMIRLTDDIRVQGGNVSLILYSLGVRRSYFNLLSQQRRYPSTTEFAGGLKGLAFNNGSEIAVVADVDHPPNTGYFLEEDTFKIYQDQDWHFSSVGGQDVWKWVDGFDAYEALLVKYWELGLFRRNASGVLKDITEA
jgi:hypothetical protein